MKLLLFFTGVCMILAVYLRILIMSEGLAVMHKTCDCDDFRADTNRVSGLIRTDSNDLSGLWKWEKDIDQYKNWSGEVPYRYYGYAYPRDSGRAVYFGQDTLSYLFYPYHIKDQRYYKVKGDSILYEPNDRWKKNAYSINEAIRFKGDTLVLISAHDGFCSRTFYNFYTRTEDTENHTQEILQDNVSWKALKGVWEMDYYDTNQDYRKLGPKFVDLRDENRVNFRTVKDTLFYKDTLQQKEFKMCFREVRYYYGHQYPTMRFGDSDQNTDVGYSLRSK